MKDTYNKLKDFCEENGLKLVTESPDENDKFYVIAKKDKWKGVQYFKCSDHVYILDKKVGMYLIDVVGRTFHANLCSPLTKEEFIAELKAEAVRRFGEIVKGDLFEAEWLTPDSFTDTDCKSENPDEWTYISAAETLYLAKASGGGAAVYKRGKWARRAGAKVRFVSVAVEPLQNGRVGTAAFYDLDITGKVSTERLTEAGKFLASQLQYFLNKN